MSNDGLGHRMARTSNNRSNEDENVARQYKVPPPEQIAVSAADHECNRHGRDEDRRDPTLTGKPYVCLSPHRSAYQAPSPAEAPTATAISLWIWLKKGTGQKDAA